MKSNKTKHKILNEADFICVSVHLLFIVKKNYKSRKRRKRTKSPVQDGFNPVQGGFIPVLEGRQICELRLHSCAGGGL